MTGQMFDKKVTSVIKGIAIVLMFVHHFFTFPHYWNEGVYYPFWNQWSTILCKPFQICVPIFCFITGYFYYFNSRKTYSYALKKCLNVLIPYWLITLVYILIAIICGYKYTIWGIILELFALKRSTMIFCWYVYFYLGVMLILPLFSRISKNRRCVKYIFSFVVLSILLVLINNYFPAFDTIIVWLPIVFSGYFAAEYSLINKIMKNSNNLPGIFILTMFIIASLARWFFPEISFSLEKIRVFYCNMDVLYGGISVFALVIFILRIRKYGVQLKILQNLGNKSLYMWFIHCIFFNNVKEFSQIVLYWPQNWLLVLIWGLSICYIGSLLCEKICNKVKTHSVDLLLNKMGLQ